MKPALFRHRRMTGDWRRVVGGIAVVLGVLCAIVPVARAEVNSWCGVPCTRFHAFDEIEGVESGAAFSFDRFGRVTLTQNGRCVVLNDEVWLDVLDDREARPQVRHAFCDEEGDAYFGGLGTFGRLVPKRGGLLVAESLLPESCPDWTRSMEFTRFLSNAKGVCFGGFAGVAFRERDTGRITFLPVAGLAALFAVGDRIFVSSHGGGVQEVDVGTGSLLPPELNPFAGRVVEEVASLGPTRVIVSTSDRRLLRYVDGVVAALPGEMGKEMGGRITALTAMPGGEVAVAVLGVGLYLISPDGEIRSFLSDLEYRDIKALGSNEPGVLWAVNRGGLLKVLCGYPVTHFSQTNGLPVFWPQFLFHRDRLLVASSGHLYEAYESAPGAPTHFRWVPEQPRQGVWGIAVAGDSLLVGNRDGVWVSEAGGAFEPVLQGMEVDRLAMVESGRCVVVGMKAIAVLERDGQGGWRECAPRVPGIGYPALVHSSSRAVWVEIGANAVGRIEWEAGHLRADVIRTFPWKDPRWVHVSVVGETIVLSGPESGRVFWDERTGMLQEHAEIESVLSRLGRQWPARIVLTDAGEIWTSHVRGISLFRRRADAWVEDTSSTWLVDCPIPRIAVVGGRGVFFSNESEVYSVASPVRSDLPERGRYSPQVVGQLAPSGEGGLCDSDGVRNGAVLPFDRNGISLRLFSGSYAARRPPHFELSTNDGPWVRMDGSSLSMSNLREGAYRLSIRLADSRGIIGTPLSLSFSVAPPWTRTGPAYVLYSLASLLVGVLLVRFAVRRSRRRNEELKVLVREKTGALEDAMVRLEQEARNSATLAERNRLAGEIHDTLEQGLTALGLQLSSTSLHPDCPGTVKDGLAIARNMVAFSRDEVRNAVWDLHSPGIGTGGLVVALGRLIEQTIPAGIEGTLNIDGPVRDLGSKTEHHLLRIAQEAVANAVKHAAPGRIEVTLRFDEDALSMVVRDDGKGFVRETARAMPVGHFGLRFLEERAAKLGTVLELCTSPGAGTTVAVTVPLPMNSPNP